MPESPRMAQRVWTALVAMTIILGSLHLEWRWAFVGVALMGYAFGLEELSRLLNWGWKSLTGAVAFSLALLVVVGWLGATGVWPVWIALGSAFAAGSVALLARRLDRPHPMAFLGLMWLLAPITGMCAAHLWWKGTGPNPVALVFMCLWGADSLALVAGKAMGKHPLAPTLSPGKTWEGSIAGVLGGIAVGAGFSAAFDISLAAGGLVGFICGALGLAGDLFESYLKRRQGVKDSGGVFPGHGGMLDRIDSLIMAAIPSCICLMAMAPEMFHVKQSMLPWLR